MITTVDMPRDAVICQDVLLTVASLCSAVYLRQFSIFILLDLDRMFIFIYIFTHYKIATHTTHIVQLREQYILRRLMCTK
jgi:hypothetical protein